MGLPWSPPVAALAIVAATQHGKRDQKGPKRLHVNFSIGPTTRECDWPKGQFGATLGDDSRRKVERGSNGAGSGRRPKTSDGHTVPLRPESATMSEPEIPARHQARSCGLVLTVPSPFELKRASDRYRSRPIPQGLKMILSRCEIHRGCIIEVFFGEKAGGRIPWPDPTSSPMRSAISQAQCRSGWRTFPRTGTRRRAGP